MAARRTDAFTFFHKKVHQNTWSPIKHSFLHEIGYVALSEQGHIYMTYTDQPSFFRHIHQILLWFRFVEYWGRINSQNSVMFLSRDPLSSVCVVALGVCLVFQGVWGKWAVARIEGFTTEFCTAARRLMLLTSAVSGVHVMADGCTCSKVIIWHKVSFPEFLSSSTVKGRHFLTNVMTWGCNNSPFYDQIQFSPNFFVDQIKPKRNYDRGNVSFYSFQA